MAKQTGRPMKYNLILERLDDYQIYTPATIASFAWENGLLSDTAEPGLARKRVRIAMGCLCKYHEFPDRGDGQVMKRGQRPFPGWFGWRWKLLLEGSNEHPEKRTRNRNNLCGR